MSADKTSGNAAGSTPEEHEVLDLNEANAEKVGVDRDGRARPAKWSWIIPLMVSLIVAMVFFSSLDKLEEVTERKTRTAFTGFEVLPEVSAEILSDVQTVLGSQFQTFGLIALYSLLPGLLGSIYRKKFWHWFLGAFAVLFVFNLIGFEFYERSVSSTMLNGLHAPPGEPDAPMQADYWRYVRIEAGLLALFLVFRLRRHVTPGEDLDKRTKNIVICLDGTWNHPGQTDWGYLAQTNVFKLFDSLQETEGVPAGHHNAARCKRYGAEGERQVAFYYNGVGNKVENSWLGQKIGGAFGLGAEAIKERAYLDVAREYEPGDRIFIFGFSRGAALARMVASTLDKRGIPKSVWTLRIFGRQRPVKTSKEHLQVKIEVLGCWDTVGSFGLAKNFFGIDFQQINLLKDLNVPISVKRAYHLVALDEDRDAFVPTLMDPDPVNPNRIVEVWFSGNHSNVGGGFATDGLSDHALSFMLQHVSSGWDPHATQPLQDGRARVVGRTTGDESWGLYLKPGRTFKPNPLGKLRVSGGAIYERFPRPVPPGAVFHDSVFERIRDDDSTYVPDGLFVHNEGIAQLRDKVSKEVGALKKTRSLDDREVEDVERWVNERLTVGKWSKLAVRPQPAAELANT